MDYCLFTLDRAPAADQGLDLSTPAWWIGSPLKLCGTAHVKGKPQECVDSWAAVSSKTETKQKQKQTPSQYPVELQTLELPLQLVDSSSESFLCSASEYYVYNFRKGTLVNLSSFLGLLSLRSLSLTSLLLSSQKEYFLFRGKHLRNIP